MDIDAIRRYCLRFPYVTENVQWGYDLVFKVDGKMFLVVRLEPVPVRMSFKASGENFGELCERSGSQSRSVFGASAVGRAGAAQHAAGFRAARTARRVLPDGLRAITEAAAARVAKRRESGSDE